MYACVTLPAVYYLLPALAKGKRHNAPYYQYYTQFTRPIQVNSAKNAVYKLIKALYKKLKKSPLKDPGQAYFKAGGLLTRFLIFRHNLYLYVFSGP